MKTVRCAAVARSRCRAASYNGARRAVAHVPSHQATPTLLKVPAALAAAALFAAACARRPASPPSCCAAAAGRIAAGHRVAAIATPRFTHAELWRALDPFLRAPGVQARDVGRSVEGRAIRAVTVGTGATTVLLWSQMHGNEPTATMALADLIAWFAAADGTDAALRRRLTSRLTIVMVPMLNPDGAERFQRGNADGADVNRDAHTLRTPEAQALKSLRDSIRPAFGFNLHDQGSGFRAGAGGPPVAIALLAPPAEPTRAWGATRQTARLLAADIASVVSAEVPGRVARFDETFEPRAFGDLMQQWGTSTVLIESGVLPDDAAKQQLRDLTAIAIVSALDAIATGRHRNADPGVYDALPPNTRATPPR